MTAIKSVEQTQLCGPFDIGPIYPYLICTHSHANEQHLRAIYEHHNSIIITFSANNTYNNTPSEHV